jgi:peptidoglycan/xylan/chitin deacetylase (PgdA/CDA1 family)
MTTRPFDGAKSDSQTRSISVTDVPDALWRLAVAAASPGGAGGRLSILIFHRVLREADSLFPGEVDRMRFDRICRWLKRWYRVLALDEAVELRAQGRLPSRAISITFDDGYADNHDVALEVLRTHGLSAAFFVATGFLDGGRMWNDTVVESVRGCPEPVIDLTDLGVPGLGRFTVDTLLERRSAIASILVAIKHLPPSLRQGAADGIAERTGVALPSDLMMTSAQVRALADAGMVIGAHTLTHPILASLSDDMARHEIEGSKRVLESLLQREVSLFAYPNGKPGQDYLPRDVAMVREVGFRAAVSTAPGATRCWDGLEFELPRFTPWDSDRWKFALRLLRNLSATPLALSATAVQDGKAQQSSHRDGCKRPASPP